MRAATFWITAAAFVLLLGSIAFGTAAGDDAKVAGSGNFNICDCDWPSGSFCSYECNSGTDHDNDIICRNGSPFKDCYEGCEFEIGSWGAPWWDMDECPKLWAQTDGADADVCECNGHKGLANGCTKKEMDGQTICWVGEEPALDVIEKFKKEITLFANETLSLSAYLNGRGEYPLEGWIFERERGDDDDSYDLKTDDCDECVQDAVKMFGCELLSKGDDLAIQGAIPKNCHDCGDAAKEFCFNKDGDDNKEHGHAYHDGAASYKENGMKDAADCEECVQDYTDNGRCDIGTLGTPIPENCLECTQEITESCGGDFPGAIVGAALGFIFVVSLAGYFCYVHFYKRRQAANANADANRGGADGMELANIAGGDEGHASAPSFHAVETDLRATGDIGTDAAGIRLPRDIVPENVDLISVIGYGSSDFKK